MTQTVQFSNIFEFIGSCLLVYCFSFIHNIKFLFFVWLQIVKQIQYMLIQTLVIGIVFFPFFYVQYLVYQRIEKPISIAVSSYFPKIKKTSACLFHDLPVFKKNRKKTDPVS